MPLAREGSCYKIGWNFGKVPKGGGSFSIQKFILQILGILNRVFEHELIQKSNFRIQGYGYVFSTIVLYCHVLHISLEIMCMHFILSGPHTYLHIWLCNHIHYKFFLSKNSSNLVAWPFPWVLYRFDIILLCIYHAWYTIYSSFTKKWCCWLQKYLSMRNLSWSIPAACLVVLLLLWTSQQVFLNQDQVGEMKI